MVQSITHSLDWMQYSLDWPSGVQDWPLNFDEEIAILRTCIPRLQVSGLPPERAKDNKAQGMQGYTKTVDMLYATVHINPQYRAQKIGVRMTGGDVSAYRDLGGDDATLVRFVNHNNATCSRVDIAFDLFDYGINLKQIYKDWTHGKVKSRARTVRPLTEGTLSDGVLSEATTLYFGSRTSEVMLRAYEKGKQQKVDMDWIRFELEIKGDRAISILADCEQVGIPQVGKQLLRDFMPTMPYKFWRELTQGKSVELTPVKRGMSERQVWLQNIVFPLLQEEIAHEWDSNEITGITGALEGIIRQNWQRRAVNMKRQYGQL